MADKTDGTPKDKGGAQDTPDGKRPHATIELKAKEVPQTKTAPDTSSKPGETKPAQASAPKTGGDYKGTPADKAAAADKTAGKKTSASNDKPPPPPKAKSGGSSIGRFFSHTFAGLLGGALAYGGTLYVPQLQNKLTPGAPDTQVVSRLADIETSTDTKIAALTEQLAATEAKLAAVEGLDAKIAALDEAQKAQASAAPEPSPKTAEELASLKAGVDKLQQRLELISRATGSETNGIANIAALTGKMSDLESTLETNLAEFNQSIPKDIETRLAAAAEASEAARSGAQRLDRELAQLRTETARLAQKDETFGADATRLTAAVDAARQEAGQLASTVKEIRGTLENKVAKPADLEAAIATVTSRIGALETDLKGIVESEKARKENAERIVLALELANLKRLVDRGQDFSSELAAVKSVAGETEDISALEKFSGGNLPPLPELEKEFRGQISSVLNSQQSTDDAGIMDRLLSGAKSFVQVRRTNHDKDDQSAEAIVGRMEAALKSNNLDAVLSEADKLPQQAKVPIMDWLDRVAARNSVDRAIASIESDLKSSLVDNTDPSADPSGTTAN